MTLNSGEGIKLALVTVPVLGDCANRLKEASITEMMHDEYLIIFR
jgi:hypothetical protein